MLLAILLHLSYTVNTGTAMPSIMKRRDTICMMFIFHISMEMITNVDKIEIPTSSGIRTYSGDEIASQHFRIHSEIYLYSSSTSYTISTTGLKAIEIRKK